MKRKHLAGYRFGRPVYMEVDSPMSWQDVAHMLVTEIEKLTGHDRPDLHEAVGQPGPEAKPPAPGPYVDTGETPDPTPGSPPDSAPGPDGGSGPAPGPEPGSPPADG